MKVDWYESVYKNINFDKELSLDYTASFRVASDLWINTAYRYDVPELYELRNLYTSWVTGSLAAYSLNSQVSSLKVLSKLSYKKATLLAQGLS